MTREGYFGADDYFVARRDQYGQIDHAAQVDPDIVGWRERHLADDPARWIKRGRLTAAEFQAIAPRLTRLADS